MRDALTDIARRCNYPHCQNTANLACNGPCKKASEAGQSFLTPARPTPEPVAEAGGVSDPKRASYDSKGDTLYIAFKEGPAVKAWEENRTVVRRMDAHGFTIGLTILDALQGDGKPRAQPPQPTGDVGELVKRAERGPSRGEAIVGIFEGFRYQIESASDRRAMAKLLDDVFTNVATQTSAELTDDEREQMKLLRTAGVGSSETTKALLNIIDRLDSRTPGPVNLDVVRNRLSDIEFMVTKTTPVEGHADKQYSDALRDLVLKMVKEAQAALSPTEPAGRGECLTKR